MTTAAPLAVTMGEPAGVGAELSLKAWLSRRTGARPFFVLDDPARLSALGRHLGLDVPLCEISR
ncbi:MAG: 4-hydroxythreonine-4-phosphate dehydrogenase, partial [Rhodospirillales bacterium]|nr:4-hydroxythreonine-4-phosphate dehydrogenase [Rhodospirillales bacterium]